MIALLFVFSFSIFVATHVNTIHAKTQINSEKNVKQLLHKYAKDVKVTSVKGVILGTDGDTVQINIKGKQNLTSKLMVKESYMNVCKVYSALKHGDISNFSNIGVAVKIDGKWTVKTDTDPATLKTVSNHDLKYKYNNLPKYTTSFWKHQSLPDIK